MKVYLINSVYKYGSTGNICAEIENKLQEKGFEARVAYGRAKQKNQVGDGYLIVGKMQIMTHVLYTRLTDRHGLILRRATEKLIEDIIAYEPDIIHLHNIHGYFLNYDVLFDFLKKYQKPVVWTLHDCWAFTGHCSYFDAAGCQKWKNQCEKCGLRKDYPQSWFADASSKNYVLKKERFTSIEKMNIVTPSVWLADRVRESFLGKYPVQIIYNGVDLKKFSPKDRMKFRKKIGAADKKMIVGVASVWSERKGLQDFVELQKYLDETYLIVLVGVNEKQKKMLPESIYCIERTENVEELAEIYSAADVYFNASIEETMGLTTVEALACNTPVVVYNKTAVPEVVPEDGGIVLEPGNIKMVKEAIDTLIRMTKKNCSEMVLHFEKSKQYEEYIMLYDKILEGLRCES